MDFSAKVIAHSKSIETGKELVTSQLTYPRFIHAEFMTHREFSRNASSSRAIPVAKMIDQVRNHPAMPIHWGANQPGMQADNQLTPPQIQLAKAGWLAAARGAADEAESLAELGMHKQVANRLLEPFQWMHVIVTTSSHSNFDGLRRHADAQPEIRHLANIWAEVREQSTPIMRAEGDWHLPYIQPEDHELAFKYLKKGRILRKEPSAEDVHFLLAAVSAARCARVSYLTHDGNKPSIEQDVELYNRLAGAQPIHASPLEHQAICDGICRHEGWLHGSQHGNFVGWRQFRKLHPGEYIN